MELQRFGGLSYIKHKIYIKDYYTNVKDEELHDEIGYHTPPEKYGLYCFPKNKIEYFLLTGKINKRIDLSKFDLYQQGKLKKKNFSVNGLIWIHIAYHDKMSKYVIKTKGSWQLIHSKNYNKILKYNHSRDTKFTHRSFVNSYKGNDSFEKERELYLKNYYNSINDRGVYSDEIEIFVPRYTKINS